MIENFTDDIGAPNTFNYYHYPYSMSQHEINVQMFGPWGNVIVYGGLYLIFIGIFKLIETGMKNGWW